MYDSIVHVIRTFPQNFWAGHQKNVDTYCQNIEMMARDLSYYLTDLYVESGLRLCYNTLSHYLAIHQKCQ